MSEAVNRGSTLSDAFAQTEDYFPPLFRELVDVGESTGKSAEVFRRLAEHFEHQLMMRRTFLAAIAWPMFQLFVAVNVFGLTIAILAYLQQDLLGLGLNAAGNLVVYYGAIFVAIALVGLFGYAAKRGHLWTHAVQRAALHVPVLGGALRTMALSRLAWSLHLTLDAGMDVLDAVPLSLRNAHHVRFTDDSEQIVRGLRSGREIHTMLEATGLYPTDFLDAVEVGEQSGRLPESMGLLSEQYQDQARRAMAAIIAVAGFLVWAVTAAFIVFLIIALFEKLYLGPINDMLDSM